MLTVSELLKQMLTAARETLKSELQDDFTVVWPQLRTYTRTELNTIAEPVAMIGRLRVEGKLTNRQAKILLDMQKHTTRAVLLTVKGIGLLEAETMINSALAAVKQVVNKALGFKLL